MEGLLTYTELAENPTQKVIWCDQTNNFTQCLVSEAQILRQQLKTLRGKAGPTYSSVFLRQYQRFHMPFASGEFCCLPGDPNAFVYQLDELFHSLTGLRG